MGAQARSGASHRSSSWLATPASIAPLSLTASQSSMNEKENLAQDVCLYEYRPFSAAQFWRCEAEPTVLQRVLGAFPAPVSGRASSPVKWQQPCAASRPGGHHYKTINQKKKLKKIKFPSSLSAPEGPQSAFISTAPPAHLHLPAGIPRRAFVRVQFPYLPGKSEITPDSHCPWPDRP